MGGMCLEERRGMFGRGDRRIVVAYNLQYSSASMRMFSSENFKLYEGVNYLLKIFHDNNPWLGDVKRGNMV